METSYVGLVYGDSLRDNFVGYTPTDQKRFNILQEEFQAEMDKPQPYLATLLRIEAGLLETLPDHMVKARFWAVEDRFQRVVPLGTRQRYIESVPKKGDSQWRDPVFVRDQTRAMVDVIHANYLINIGREKSVKRLKLIMAVAFLILVAIAAFVILITCLLSASAWQMVEMRCYLALMVAGLLGATLSIANRLQTAIARDAMTEDGLFELTGLRVGWVGVVTSQVMGSAFAIVLYWIVMAGVLDKALPISQAEVSQTYPPGGNAEGTPTSADTGKKSTSSDSPAASVFTKTAASGAPLSPHTATTRTKAEEGKATATCPKIDTNPCKDVKPTIYQALGLATYPDFFKMLILAFLAGFAERFVPDILSRLSKTDTK